MKKQTLTAPTLKTVPQFEQSQASLAEQLLLLRDVANRVGLYDAADYLRAQS